MFFQTFFLYFRPWNLTITVWTILSRLWTQILDSLIYMYICILDSGLWSLDFQTLVGLWGTCVKRPLSVTPSVCQPPARSQVSLCLPVGSSQRVNALISDEHLKLCAHRLEARMSPAQVTRHQQPDNGAGGRSSSAVRDWINN